MANYFIQVGMAVKDLGEADEKEAQSDACQEAENGKGQAVSLWRRTAQGAVNVPFLQSCGQ